MSRRVARNSTWGIAAQLAIKVLSFSFTVLVLRHLGAESFGQYAAVLAFGALFVFGADLGLGTHLVRETARLRSDGQGAVQIERLYGHVLYLRVVLSLLATTLMITAAWLTGRPPAMIGAIALGGIGLVVYSVQGTSDGILAGHERIDLTSQAKVLNQLTCVVVGGLALWLGFGYYGLVIANVLGAVVMAYWCWQAVRRLGLRVGKPDPAFWPALLRASIPFGIIAFTLGLSYKFDSVLLNIFRGDAETGYYTAAYNLVFSAAILSNAFNTALFPSLTRHEASSPGGLKRVYERAFCYLMILGLPIAAGASALADRIVPALFTASYAPAIPALQVVIWAVPLMYGTEFLGYLAVINGRETRVARAVILSTALNVGLNLVLVPRFGFLAAAGMTVATEAVLLSQYLWMLRSLLKGLNWNRALFRPMFASAVMAALVFGLHNLPLPLVVAIGALAYGGLLLGLRVVGRDELRFMRRMREREPPADPRVDPGPGPVDVAA